MSAIKMVGGAIMTPDGAAMLLSLGLVVAVAIVAAWLLSPGDHRWLPDRSQPRQPRKTLVHGMPAKRQIYRARAPRDFPPQAYATARNVLAKVGSVAAMRDEPGLVPMVFGGAR